MPLIDIIGIIYLFDNHKCGGQSTSSGPNFKTNLKILLAYTDALNITFVLINEQKSVHRGLPAGIFFSVHVDACRNHILYSMYMLQCLRNAMRVHIGKKAYGLMVYEKNEQNMKSNSKNHSPPYGNQMISNSKFLTLLES